MVAAAVGSVGSTMTGILRFSIASLTSLPYLKLLLTYLEISLVVLMKTSDCLASEQS
jgi:hypothetical protein